MKAYQINFTERNLIMQIILVALLVSLLLVTPWQITVSNIIPVTASDINNSSPDRSDLPALSEFQMRVKNDNPEKLSGVYVPGLLAMPVVQQPANDPAYVSISQNTITQFRMADRYGTIGLLAHNFLAGKEFFNLDIDQVVILIYGDTELDFYRIKEIREYQALSPDSPYSSFISLDDPSRKLSSTDLFMQTYNEEENLVFQTCIENGDSKSWGRRFVIAERMTGFKIKN